MAGGNRPPLGGRGCQCRNDVWKDQDWQAPRTWGELDRAAADARKPSQVTKTFPYGYVTQLDEYEGLTVNAQEAVWAADGEIVDEKGHVRARSPETEKGLGELADRYRNAMPPEADSADERDSLEMFRDEKVAFMRNWPYVYNVLSAEGSKVRGKFGVVALPGVAGNGVSVLGGQNLAITMSSGHAAEAQDLLDYLVRPAQQRCLLDAGFAPVLRISYEADGPQCSLPDESGKGQEGADPLAGSKDPDGLPPYTYELKNAVANARPRPVTPYYAAFTELVQTEVHDQLKGGGEGGAVATELDKGLKKVMKGG